MQLKNSFNLNMKKNYIMEIPKIKKKTESSKRSSIIYIHAKKILSVFLFFLFCCFSYTLCNSKIDKMKFEINYIFNNFNKININDIYNKYYRTKTKNNEIIKNKIDIEFTLDPNYILETMLTISSIMNSQNKTTKIVFHLGVINNFTAENMLKIYSLKNKINNLTEFNFYYLREAMKKMKNFHYKGEACPGKFELPQLLSDDVGKILLFDAGDVIIFKDLTELYNYDMKNYWVLGLPEPCGIEHTKKYTNSKKYLNIGALIINVTEFKINNIWDKYTKKRYLHYGGAPDQTLFNVIIPDDKKDYFPFRLGVYSIFIDDYSFKKNLYDFDYGLKSWFSSELNNLPDNPKTMSEYFSLYNNSIFIHQFIGKWSKGQGLSICRNSAKYSIKLANIWNELCIKKPGYCK